MKILRIKQVLELTGISRSTLYLYIKNQQFPMQIKLGEKIVGWMEDEVHGWILERREIRNIETK